MKNFFKKIIELLFPNQCLHCSHLIGQEGVFCNDCWKKLQFITDPKCNICCHPFEYKVADNLICGKCLGNKPSYNRVITVFRYNSVIKKIIGDFKSRDTTYLAKKFAKILFNRASSEIAKIDLIVAVPLHKIRLRKRKFNQAILLTKELSKLSKKKFFYDFLLRIKNTTAQAGLKKREREKNLRGAFALNKKYKKIVKGKKILLIDDVMTTGTTLEGCAKILKKAGAKEVIVLVIAKRVFNQIH
jgi:ComF family protein